MEISSTVILIAHTYAFAFLVLVLRPFQDYFTHIDPIANQRCAKTAVPGEINTWPSVAELGVSHVTKAHFSNLDRQTFLKCVSTDGVTVIGCREYFSALSGLLDGSCINVGYSTASAHKPGHMNYMRSIRCEHEQRLPWAPPIPEPTPSRAPLLYIKGIG